MAEEFYHRRQGKQEDFARDKFEKRE